MGGHALNVGRRESTNFGVCSASVALLKTVLVLEWQAESQPLGCASPEPVTHRLLNKFCPDSVPVKINLKWDPITPTYSTLPRAALGI